MNTAQVPGIDAGELTVVKSLGSGGQGEVFLVEPHPPADPTPVAYKRYLPAMLPRVDVDALERLVTLYHAQETLSQTWIADRMAWPTHTVTDGGRKVGFLMQLAPARFVKKLNLLSGETDKLLAMQFLLNPADFLTNRGILLSDRHRIGLLRDVASTLSWLHEHGAAVGDLSPNNIVVSLDPEPRCFLLDCDAIRLRGASVTDQAETPDWQIPTGEEKATPASDVYKFALLAIRLFTNDQSIRDPDTMPPTFAELRELARRSMAAPPARPPLDEWITALDRALPTASPHTQQMPVVPSPVRFAPPPAPPSAPPAPPPPKRRRGRLVAAALGLVILVCVGVSISKSLSQANPAASSGSDGNTQQPTPGPTGTTRPAAATFPAAFAGGWTGTLNEDNSRDWTMNVHISAGKTTATVAYPQLGCSGTLTVVSASGDVARVREHITHKTTHNCTPSGSMTLSMQPDGSMSLTYAPDDGAYSATATLQPM